MFLALLDVFCFVLPIRCVIFSILILLHADSYFCFLYDSDHKSRKPPGDISGSSTPGNRILTDEHDIFSKMGSSRMSKKYQLGLSCSDAEIDYRSCRSVKEGKGDFKWH